MGDNWLDQLVGEWSYESQSVPADPAHHRTGAETVIRKGEWLIIESGDDYRFQLTHNPATEEFTGDFLHWKHPQLWTYVGGVKDGKLHMRSRGPSFDVEGAEADYDDVFEIISPDERRLTGRLIGKDGEWRDFMVTTFRRKA
jgi:hypothetical protein